MRDNLEETFVVEDCIVQHIFNFVNPVARRNSGYPVDILLGNTVWVSRCVLASKTVFISSLRNQCIAPLRITPLGFKNRERTSPSLHPGIMILNPAQSLQVNFR